MFVIVRKKEREVEEGRVTKIRTGRETQRNRLSRVQAKKNMCKRKNRKEAAAIELRTKDLHTHRRTSTHRYRK